MVLDLLLIALAITLDPLPLMAFVLVVASAAGARKGLAFLTGWVACLLAVIAAVLLATGGQPPHPRSPPSTLNLAARLLVGVALIGYGIHRRRRPPPDRKPREAAAKEAHPVLAAVPAGARLPVGGGRTRRLPPAVGPRGRRCHLRRGGGHIPHRHLAGAAGVLPDRHGRSADRRAVCGAQTRGGPGTAAAAAHLDAGHKEPAIVYGSVVVGLWLVGRSIYGLAG